MKNKIKVLEVCPGNFGKGGISVIVWKWYCHFDRERITADIAAFITPDEKYIDEIRSNGGEFLRICKSSNKFIRLLEKYNDLRKIAKKNRYDAIHIHSDTAFSMALFYIAARKFCGNIILHSHSTGIDGGASAENLFIKLKKLLHELCRPLLSGKNISYAACSDAAAKWMFPKNVFINRDFSIIANGIEADKFIFDPSIRNEVREELSLTDKFVIGHVGRFAYPKNHDFLIDVFAQVWKKNKNAVLLLIGNGELEEKMKKKAADMGIDKAVIFYGTSPDIHRLYQAMDCFVFPSRFEGLGMVAVEAQAAGLKTICADTVPEEAGLTELFEHISLDEPPQKWAERILCCDNSYERKNMADEINKKGYNINQSAKQLEDMYSDYKK